MFMRIAKAYETLTGEEAQKNWEEFGNPNGPQVTSFGVALPVWIIDQKKFNISFTCIWIGIHG